MPPYFGVPAVVVGTAAVFVVVVDVGVCITAGAVVFVAVCVCVCVGVVVAVVVLPHDTRTKDSTMKQLNASQRILLFTFFSFLFTLVQLRRNLR